MHNLEEKPRTHLIAVRWGYGGVLFGVAGAVIGIVSNWMFGDGSAYEAGVGLGMAGLIAGLSCAFIGWISGRI